MRFSATGLSLALIMALLAGCSAMMLGGGKSYPPADCREGQAETEDGCRTQDKE